MTPDVLAVLSLGNSSTKHLSPTLVHHVHLSLAAERNAPLLNRATENTMGFYIIILVFAVLIFLCLPISEPGAR